MAVIPARGGSRERGKGNLRRCGGGHTDAVIPSEPLLRPAEPRPDCHGPNARADARTEPRMPRYDEVHTLAAPPGSFAPWVRRCVAGSRRRMSARDPRFPGVVGLGGVRAIR